MVTHVYCKRIRERVLKINVGITLMETPRSNKEFSNLLSPMVGEMEKVHRFLHFLGIGWIRAANFYPMLTI